jgi:O-antigen/teichoic acid export membrane protein
MKIFHKLLNYSIGGKQIAYVTLGNIFSTSLSAIALIFISRILGPEGFGLFSVGLSISLILVRINDFGLNSAVIKYAVNAKQSDKIFIYSLVFRYKLILSAAIIILGAITSNYFINLIRFESPTIFWLAFTIGLSTSYYEQLLNVLQSLHFFKKVVLVNTIQALSKLIGTIVLLILKIKNANIFFALFAFSPLVPVFFSKFLLPSWFSLVGQKNQKIRTSILNMAKHSSIALISAGFIENIDVLFLQSHLTTYETGLYAGIAKIALMFSLVAYSFGGVLNARVAKYKSKDHLSKYIKKALLLFLLCILGFLLFIPFAPQVIYFTIGSSYMTGSSVLIVLLAASFLSISSIPFIALFYSYDVNWYFSLSGIIQLLIVVLGNFIFVPIYGLEASAWTRLTSRIFLILFSAGLGMFFYWKNYVKVSSRS